MSDKNAKDVKNYHSGHRSRLRSRYLSNGIDALAEHEVLELVLFYSIPRKDTKVIAYKLIEHFGSFANVFDAPIEALIKFGLTPVSASHIKLFSDVNSRMEREELLSKKTPDYDELGEYAVRELGKGTGERVIAFLMDSKDKVIDIVTISEGISDSAEMNIKKLNEICVLKKISKVVLAHNHPAGSKQPSFNDCMTTHSLQNFFGKIGIEVAEHYIVSGKEFVGLKKYEQMKQLVPIEDK